MARGIRHLCDEKIKEDEFQYFLDNMEKFEVTEKVDGTNLTFGLDASGEFYINRDKKDGRNFGNIYPNNKYLLGLTFSKIFDILHKFVNTGAIRLTRDSKIEIEVIDDPITNVVPYDPRQLIILNREQGHIDIYTDQIHLANPLELWTIRENRPIKVNCDMIRTLFGLGNSRQDALVEMKKMLLDRQSNFGSNNPESWVEGLVFKYDEMIYKLVNKDRFTVMNKFLHKIRSQLSAPKPSGNYPGGLFQEMIYEIANFYSVGPIATSQRKRFMADNPTWANSVAMNDSMFFSRNLLIVSSIIIKYKNQLVTLKSKYMSTWNDTFIETPYGKCYIDIYTHSKNLLMFQNVLTKINDIEADINSNTDSIIGLKCFNRV